jgi:hypothetical protein
MRILPGSERQGRQSSSQRSRARQTTSPARKDQPKSKATLQHSDGKSHPAQGRGAGQSIRGTFGDCQPSQQPCANQPREVCDGGSRPCDARKCWHDSVDLAGSLSGALRIKRFWGVSCRCRSPPAHLGSGQSWRRRWILLSKAPKQPPALGLSPRAGKPRSWWG